MPDYMVLLVLIVWSARVAAGYELCSLIAERRAEREDSNG